MKPPVQYRPVRRTTPAPKNPRPKATQSLEETRSARTTEKIVQAIKTFQEEKTLEYWRDRCLVAETALAKKKEQSRGYVAAHRAKKNIPPRGL